MVFRRKTLPLPKKISADVIYVARVFRYTKTTAVYQKSLETICFPHKRFSCNQPRNIISKPWTTTSPILHNCYEISNGQHRIKTLFFSALNEIDKKNNDFWSESINLLCLFLQNFNITIKRMHKMKIRRKKQLKK